MKITQRVRQILPDRFEQFARKVYLEQTIRKTPRFKRPFTHSGRTLDGVIAYNQYGGYYIARSFFYRVAAQKILSGDVHEPNTIEFIIAQCKGGGDIVHAGTFFGDFLPALSKHCQQTIWAFEPSNENYRCAQITVNLNGLENVVLMNACLGEKHESLVLVTSNDNGVALGGASRVLTSENEASYRNANKETVECVAIDDVIPPSRHVSCIHLDVERFEQQALSGARKTIRRCHPTLIVEHLPEQTWLSENILQLGYQEKCTVHYNTVFVHHTIS